ncbi:LacI family DNA-binding transcriptional regulator [Nocardia terpenica]|uniref:Integrase n=1 Tax=Nocardia terpenica TaxID=455432 RepID=A0A164K8B3_9NOCA|nr:LacI family DNA-binding transcriptional regulator [Nocardia terpenica]KZM71137.1 hypothetical protein AWN90_42255 [Nocardia terpenica]NQE89536.1 LacI family DNA-binding transcriptional regulator [Nocardia terpenica]
MAYPKKRGTGRDVHYTAYFAVAPQVYEPVKDPETGRVKKFDTEKRAQKAADDAEINYKVAQAAAMAVAETYGTPADMRGSRDLPAFAAYADRWYGRQDLARGTMDYYKRGLENHLIPYFGEKRLDEIDKDIVAAWERYEREEAGNNRSSIHNWRSLLHTVMSDALDEYPSIGRNPADRKRGRGRRTNRHRRAAVLAAPIIGDFDGLLLAERAAVLSRRPDEFVAETTRRWCGLRTGELWGLQTKCVANGRIHVEAQLTEIDGAQFVEDPKDESFRAIDLPPFLGKLVEDHIARASPRSCPCHGLTFVFSGRPRKNPKSLNDGVSLASVARHLGVSKRTVQIAFGSPGQISEDTRRRVLDAAGELGYIPPNPNEIQPHWWRGDYYKWIYVPAATGTYTPHRKGEPRRPVVVDATEFPGVPVRGPYAARRASGEWSPITNVTRPHWNRHSHRTILTEMGVPKVLIDERIGHSDTSVQAVYTHVTQKMRGDLVEELEARWWRAVDARLALHPRSVVPLLDEILYARAKEIGLSIAA